MSWTVVLTASAQRDVRRLDRPVAARTSMRSHPAADHLDEWRLRVGDWRVRFRYDHPTRTLEVLRILPWGQVYRQESAVGSTTHLGKPRSGGNDLPEHGPHLAFI